MCECECDCGNVVIVRKSVLNDGRTRSCGCLHREIMRKVSGGKNNPMYGKKHSLETRLKISQNLPDRSGSNNGRWNPTLTEEDRLMKRITPEYLTWRNSVFERDDYTCVYCGNIGGDLEAHHLESYAKNPELRFNVNNGVTMCVKHHRKFHNKYGCIGNTTEQFLTFIGGNTLWHLPKRMIIQDTEL